jgi:hypothetical protein
MTDLSFRLLVMFLECMNNGRISSSGQEGRPVNDLFRRHDSVRPVLSLIVVQSSSSSSSSSGHEVRPINGPFWPHDCMRVVVSNSRPGLLLVTKLVQ